MYTEINKIHQMDDNYVFKAHTKMNVANMHANNYCHTHWVHDVVATLYQRQWRWLNVA